MPRAPLEDTLSIKEAVSQEWDIIVVGGGAAGTSAARAAASKGAETLIIEKEDYTLVGKKVCGDAVAHHHFTRTNIPPPNEGDCAAEYEGMRVTSPDLKTRYTVLGRGYSVNRHQFGQRLLREALAQGTKLLSDTRVTMPICGERDVIGVIARSVDGKEVSIRSKIVIDASGWRGAIRKEMAPRIGVEKKFSSKDMVLCYREIRLLSKPLDEYNYTDIFLDVKIAPGGYWWLFPKEDGRKINIGVGVLMNTASNPRRLYEKYLASLPIMKNSKLIDAGAGSVPTRKPLHTLVDNGVIFIGDAASAANPVHGGGIGQSMFSGTLAGETAAQAVSEGDVSRDRLWGINVTFMRSYGRQNASLDIFRIFLQKLENRDINYGMAKRLVDETDLQHVEVEKSIELSLNKKVERAIRGLRRPSLLRRLAHVSGAMRRVRELYEEYPETSTGIEGWIKEEEEIFKGYERSL